ncbi:DUF1330 domain-containing protein [Cognatishimia maritima]|uniref:Uncharacterized conserved protein, DUF1330 family n=1 Tax=Cognatishimia maritima TaxID=870908 RepID=A0A1M5IPT2_9RHOB|nr:DUF1330 domain-containing protein [Cognatishimia maritima]SHG30236.1 Uncharacterized conserved protein, DUF1330 family [Cognatishimia maritima]
MPALWISHVTVSDPEAYAEYAKCAVPVIETMGGQFIARGAAFKQLEGVGADRHTIIRFPSLTAAENCYNSAAYQEAVQFAEGASERSLTIIEVDG